jgi:plastocyanin
VRWARGRSMTLLAVTFGAVAVLAFTAAGAEAATGTVPISNFSYQPSTVTVPAGSTVTWTNNDPAPHSVTADRGSFDSSPGCSPNATRPCLAQGATFSHTFGVAGTFTYHCLVHSFMHGTVVVTAPSAATVAAPPTSGRSTFASNVAALGLLGAGLACAGGVVYVVERRRPAASR